MASTEKSENSFRIKSLSMVDQVSICGTFLAGLNATQKEIRSMYVHTGGLYRGLVEIVHDRGTTFVPLSFVKSFAPADKAVAISSVKAA